MASDSASLTSSSAFDAIIAFLISVNLLITNYNLVGLNLADNWTRASIGWFFGNFYKAFWTSASVFCKNEFPLANNSSSYGIIVSKAPIALESLYYLLVKFSISLVLAASIAISLSARSASS